MTDFTFDLQRFTDHTVSNQSDIDALTLSEGDTITFSSNITNGTGFTLDKNVTVNFNGHTYSGTGTITTSGSGTTFTGGTISGINISNSNGLTLTNMTLGSSSVTTTGSGTTTYNVGTQALLTNAIASIASGGTATINLTAAISGTTATGFTIGDNKNITVNFGNYTYTAANNSTAVTVAYGATATLSGGTISASNTAIANSGTLTLTSMKVGNGSVTSSTGTISATSSTITLSNGKTFTYNDSSNNKTTYAATSSNPVTFTYDNSEIKITSLDTGSTFTATPGTSSSSTETVTYTVSDAGIYATRGTTTQTTKIYMGTKPIQSTPIALSDLDFDSSTSKMKEVILTDSSTVTNLTLSSTNTSNMTTGGDGVPIYYSADYSKKVGTLTKDSSGTLTIKKESGVESYWKSVTINDGLIVKFDSETSSGGSFNGMPITVNSNIFSAANDVDFTVSGSEKITIDGDSTSTSLQSGIIFTKTTAQSVIASNYTVSAYNTISGYNGDGIEITVSSGNASVGDIDIGESFKVGDTEYIRKNFGLVNIDNNSINKLYMGDNESDPKTVDLSTLADNMKPFVTLTEVSNSKVFTLGSTNNYSAVVVNAAPTEGEGSGVVKYANYTADPSSSTYVLDTLTNGNAGSFKSSIDTIYAYGKSNTINKSLVDSTVTIVTSNSSVFKVTDNTTGTFVVDGTTQAPEISGATNITLIGGSITATAGQTITLGTLGKTLIVGTSSAGMQITVSGTDPDYSYTITGNTDDVFTLDGQSYSIGNGSMTFTVDKDGNVTLGDLDKSEYLNVNNAQYSVVSSGFFIKNNSTVTADANKKLSIWTDSSAHSLTTGSVAFESLTVTEKWSSLATVFSDGSATIPPGNYSSGQVTLISNDFQNLYGTLKQENGSYVIETLEGAQNLSTVSIDSGIVSMGQGVGEVTISSGVATLSVTDGGTAGYGVTLISSDGAATVTSGDSVSLIKGTLKADKDVPVTIAELNRKITAGDNTTITVATNADSNATITGLDTNKSFSVDGYGTYTFSGVIGLTKGTGDNAQYLLDSSDKTVTLNHLLDNSNWGTLVAASALTIKADTGNELVVDNVSSATTLYAEYDKSTKTLSKSSGTDAEWDTNQVIHIDAENNSSFAVTLTSYFADASIKAEQSTAEFSVSNTNKADFIVTDKKGSSLSEISGATVSGTGATTINQTAGLIALTGSGQTIVTGSSTKHSINTTSQPINVSVASDKVSIGAIDSGDSFTVDNVAYTRRGVGLMTNSDNKLLNSNYLTSNAVDVDNLSKTTDTSYWTSTVTLQSDVLTIPTDTSGVWTIIDSGASTNYGSITVEDGAYTINKTAESNVITISAADKSKAIFTTGKNTFTVTVKDGTGGASITGTDNSPITLTSGLIAPQNDQAVFIGTTTNTITGTTSTFNVSVNGSAATIGGLDNAETFKVNNVTYTLLSNGRFQRSGDNLVWSGDTISTSSGSIVLSNLLDDDNWNGLTNINATDGNFTINSAAVAFTATNAFVHDQNDNTKIYGTLTRNADKDYTLSTVGATDSMKFKSVTIDQTSSPKVTFTTDFKDVTIKAGTDTTAFATFEVTGAETDFTVNYDGSAASVSFDATAIKLDDGTLTINGTNQTITAGEPSNTVKAASGYVTVNYTETNGLKVTLDTANESAEINGTTYTLTTKSGEGLVVTVSDSSTVVSGMTSGDEFTIGSDTFKMTAIGLLKTTNSSAPKLWTSTDTTYTTDDLIGTENWTGLVAATSDALTINASSTAGIIVDSLTDPTKIYGTLTGSTGSYELTADKQSTGASLSAITVDSTTVDIATDFNAVPVKLNNATKVTYGEKTITGTVDKVLLVDMKFTLVTGDTFTLDGTEYIMTEAGLTKDSSAYIYTTNVTEYALPGSTWSPMLTLESGDATLNISNKTLTDGSTYVIVNNGKTSRVATLGLSGTSYTFNATDGGTIGTIHLPDGILTVTTDFASSIETGSGTYTVNNKTYKGSSLTIAATATSSTLNAGTVTIEKDVSVTADGTITNNGDGSITATAASGAWSSVGSLNDGDTFTIGDTSYKVLGQKTLVKLDTNGKASELYTGTISNNTLAYSAITGSNYSAFIGLDADGYLDLQKKLEDENYIVVGYDTVANDGTADPTIRVADLKYSDDTYTLSVRSDGKLTSLTGVKLNNSVRAFVNSLTSKTLTVITTGNYVFTINDKYFYAQDNLSIEATPSTGAVLTDGKVKLAAGRDYEEVTAPNSEVIAATNGSVDVEVDGTTVTISDMDSAETFTFNGTEYLQTTIGLADSAKTKLNRTLTTGSVVTTALDMTGSAWEDICNASGGALTIDSSTLSSAAVVDLKPKEPVEYGTITKSGSTYVYTTTGETLKSITITGVTAQIDKSCAGATITAGGATFTVTATENFTVNASTPTVTNVTAIDLTSGTLTVPKNVPVTAGDYTVTTSDSMTLTNTGGTVVVDGLEVGEKFTVNDTTYTMTAAGLIDGNNNLSTDPSTSTVTLNTLAWGHYIATDSKGVLDLTSTTKKPIVGSNIIVNSAMTKQLATLEYDGTEYGFTAIDGNTVSNIILPDGTLTATTDFATTVETGSGTYTVNGSSYKGSSLTIDATTTSSTLYTGTVTLTDGDTVKATNSGTITVVSGDTTVTASKGDFVSGTKSNTVKLSDGTINITTDFATTVETGSGTYTVNGSSYKGSSLTIDATTTSSTLNTGTVTLTDGDTVKATNSGTITVVSGDTTVTASKGDFVSGTKSNTVKLSDGTINITTDFATTVETGSGTYTVNGSSYKGSSLTIDATKTSSTLYTGTVTLTDGEDCTATVSGKLAIVSGDVEATATKGTFTKLDKIATGDSFTYGDHTYTQTARGLMREDGTVREDLVEDNLDPRKLDSGWLAFIAPENGTLDLTTIATNAIVYDNTDAPTTKLGEFSINSTNGKFTLKGEEVAAAQITTIEISTDTNLTVDFVTKVEAPAGVIVNKKSYTATAALTIDTTADTSTLNTGVVTISKGESVKATKDTTELKVTSGDIIATASEGNFTTISGLIAGEKFTFSGKTYTQSAIGLICDDDGTICEDLIGAFDVEDLSNATWQNFIAPNSKSVLDLTSPINALIVDQTFDAKTLPTKLLGTLTVADTKLTIESQSATDSASAIATINIAANSELDVDFVTNISAPSTVTVNSKIYNSDDELTIHSDGTTSTLTKGTVTLTSGGEVTTTTTGNNITATGGSSGLLSAASSGVLTVDVDKDGVITLSNMTSGSTFTIDDATYKVTAVGPMNEDGKLWTGTAYTEGIKATELPKTANWTAVKAVSSDIVIKSDTLADGDAPFVMVDNASNPTTTYGILSKSGDKYTLDEDGLDSKDPSSITVNNTVIDIIKDFSDVPIITINSDGSETDFTVTPAAGEDYFTVNATGTAPTVDGVSAIEVSKGTIRPQDGQTVTTAEGAEDVNILLGNGTYTIGDKTFTLAGLPNDKGVSVDVDKDGNPTALNGLTNGASVTPKDAGDGDTITATADNTTVNYSDADGYYLTDYEKESYTVNVDKSGNVTVDAGVQFTKVVSSGRKLDSNATINLAVNTDDTPVTVNNNGSTTFNLNDTNSNFAKNFGKQSGVVFNEEGITSASLDDARGTTFIAEEDQTISLGDDFKVIADAATVEVAVGKNNASVTGAATITAPVAYGLTLGATEYTINGVELTPSGETFATATADGVEVDLLTSEPLTYDGMTFDGAGTAILAKDKIATLTSGATVTNATDKTLNINGTVELDGKTINATEATDVTGTNKGITVGDTTLQVTGDDIYTINIGSDSVITGLENIGAASGVTVAGLSTATILTDAAGPFTVDRKFTANSGALYSIDNSTLNAASEVTTISGDFSKALTVNNTPYTVTGGTPTIDADGTVHTNAGTFNINGKTYTTSQPTDFTTSNGSVTGAKLSDDGTFVINQNENNFNLNDDTLTLSRNSNPVTLSVDGQSGVVEAYGINGIINGLDDAIVYDVTRATIDSKPIYIRGDEVDAIVSDGETSHLKGLNSGATVSTAPTMTVTSDENGSFTFPNGNFAINDADNSVDFITDSNSRVTNIAGLSGSVSGSGVKDISVNDKEFATNGDVTLTADGKNITGIDGVESGNTLSGDLSSASLTMPEGSITMNGAAYTLSGDDSVLLSDDGKMVTGFAKDASLTLGAAGNYTIDGTTFAADAGDVYTANRDGVYKIDTDNPPINDTTPAANILSKASNPVYVSGGDSIQLIDISDEKTLALVDNALASVKTGMGNDSVIARQGSKVTVDVADGDATIIATNADVRIDNYNDTGAAAVQTFEYTNIPAAVKSNAITFGDGVMTIGDAVITFSDTSSRGSTLADIINATGTTQAVAFTHTAGGNANVSTTSAAYVMKGNYAESSADTTKSAGSTLVSGTGNDTLLIGAGDTANAGGGTNQIYVTDSSLRTAGATIVLGDSGTTTVHKFSGGHATTSDRIQISDLDAVEFGYASGLVMTSGNAQLTFDGLTPSTALVSVTGANSSLNAASPYEVKLLRGSTTYNAAIAQSGKGIAVVDGDTGNLFYGNENGISFSEYSGAVAVNLNNGSGTVGGRSAQFKGDITKVAAGSGNTTITGADGVSNTLMAGTGNGLIRSGSGADLMVGTRGYDKTGMTRYYYTSGYGNDTITNFDFMASSGDTDSDYIEINASNVITSVTLQGNNVVIGINNDSDYLTIADAKGQHMVVNDVIAKVDSVVAFDGYTDCYVGGVANSTLSVASGMGDVGVWLGADDEGASYIGTITVLNASAANGNNTLTGNEFNNLIIGGTGSNSVWGGDGNTNDTLQGGTGSNTFFFALENGNDLIQNAHDGDVVDMTTVALTDITSTAITDGGVEITLRDGSKVSVASNASIDYKLKDGLTYTADHSAHEWNLKS